MNHLDRVRALLKELEQALDALEAEQQKPKRRRPAARKKPDALTAIRETRRRLRGAA